MEEVPRRTSRAPLASPCLCLFVFISLERKGLLDFQGRRGIASVARWNPRPVIFGVKRCLRIESANAMFMAAVVQGENARFKNGHARVETRVLKTLACRNGFLDLF